MVEIRRIEIDKLFGLYNHRIDLHSEEHITLLHGPNGVGKTAILRLLNGLLNSNYEALCSVPFNEFRVYFTDNRWLCVKQEGITSEETLFSNAPFGIKIDVFKGEKPLKSAGATSLSPRMRKLAQNILALPSSETRQVDTDKWIMNSYPRILTTEQAIRYVLNNKALFENSIPRSAMQELQRFQQSQPLTELLGDTKAYLIGTNRLLPPTKMSRRRVNSASMSVRTDEYNEEQPTSAIQHHANVIRDIIASTLSQYSSVSIQRDRTFPERMVHRRSEHASLSDDELRDKFVRLEKRRDQLESAGLLDSQAAGRPFMLPAVLNETTSAVLSIYVEDTEQKLAVFDEVEARLALLKQIVDKRFLHTKKFSIDRKKGFTFHVGTQEIDLDQLSSGEQHELVVFCEMLFTVPDGSYILIDEPELSLHVAWQLEFLTDLQAVTRIRPMEILIATHSPWIINNHWNLTAVLSGDEAEEPEALPTHITQHKAKISA